MRNIFILSIIIALIITTLFGFHFFNIPLPIKERAIENSFVRISFSPGKGTFTIINKKNWKIVLKDARFSFDNYISSDPGFAISCIVDSIGKTILGEKSIKISGTNKEGITIGLNIKISEDSVHVVFTPFFTNMSMRTIRLKNIYAIADGLVYPDQRMDKVQLLDGNGGGEYTHVRNEPYCISRNNILFTGNVNNRRVSFTMGGLSYEYFEKFASVTTVMQRKQALEKNMYMKGLKLLSYLNLGGDQREVSNNGITIKLQQGQNNVFSTMNILEINQIAQHKQEVIVNATGLDPAQAYTIGFTWVDDYNQRVQNVSVVDVSEPDRKIYLMKQKVLPSASNLDTVKQFLFNLPKGAYRSGKFWIYFEKEKGPDAVASEFWISEGALMNDGLSEKIIIDNSKGLLANLYASDPVGRRVIPGNSVSFDNDKLYFDAITEDPFKSVENYAHALKAEQKINIRHYTFPTVCLWYASHKGYGGEAMATNDSKGAVEEMERIVKSGFLTYSTAAVRLVPDSYYPNNEQGWWDESHWQKYGSGGGSEGMYNVKVEGGHYKPPYETTKKWAGTVTEMGGIPIMYFQTSVRSQDYAEAFRGHMLFNEVNYETPNVWPNPNKSGYDFTDKGFIAHMNQVYANLHNGGVQGLMFDYPESGWSAEGGFEDQDVTTAYAYRNIFKLAYNGLFKDSSLIHERNIARGSDVTLGLVASQRVWGDTDGITPEMMSRCGLRWYKNRVVVSYDTDSKNLVKFRTMSRDKLRQALTMVYVSSGRLLMGNSFGLLTKDDIHDLSRIFPFHTTLQSARPIDAFVNTFPTVYDFKVDSTWHLLTLYNPENQKNKIFEINLSKANVDGGLALDPSKEYYFYDFWNNNLIGKFSGNENLKQELRPDEARMISVRQAEKYPQVLSTNRHIMQGFIDLKDVKCIINFNKGALRGMASVIGGEPFKIFIALNGFKLKSYYCNRGTYKSNFVSDNLVELIIENPKNAEIGWSISF